MARLGGCARPRSSPPAQGSSRCAPSYAPTGEPTLSGAPLSPCFAAESAREGTLMSLPEGAPARSGSGAESGYSKYTFGKRGHPLSQRGKAVSSEVTSGCPKRSEGGSPVGTRTNTAFRAEPCRTWNGTREHERGAASHTGDSASFVRAGSAEKLSLPHRTQPESAHARGRRQPDRG